jgi:ribosomal protein S18 acetylase RimI-like enzyme
MTPSVVIRPAEDFEFDWCAQLMAGNDPWLTYKCPVDWCRNVLNWPGSSLYIADAGQASGFILLHRRGFLGSPYIAAVAVAEELRGNGIGGAMLDFAERAFSGTRHVFLCVSSFNPRAQQLYERHGYGKMGELQDFIADGFTEFLMCKRLP